MVKAITFYDACKQMVEKGSYALVRGVPEGVDINWDSPELPTEEQEQRQRSRKAPRRKGWTLIDIFTASNFVQLFEALNPENQAKMNSFDFSKQVSVMWAVLSKK